MQVWSSIEQVAMQLERDAEYHEKEAGHYEKILAAGGDCSVISGWDGRLKKGTLRANISQQKGIALGKRAAAQQLREAIKQCVPLNQTGDCK